ncbi:hypothetical protein [Paramagnetospirillum magneticum]|uniref:hypothetical protein n=1 Tax=Paramagnetospirillum magneticum TaxID=84159 RepID=UPI0011D04BC7|nr:hypothetical protein [Paramagnetospirillum magneticum]
MFDDEIDLNERHDVWNALADILYKSHIIMRGNALKVSEADGGVVMPAIGDALHNVPKFLLRNSHRRFSPSYFISCLEILTSSMPLCGENGKEILRQVHEVAISSMLGCGFEIPKK